jgi:hypothetical protein
MNKYFESSYLAFEITSSKNLDFVLEVFEHLRYLEENDNNTWKHRDTSGYYFNQRPIGGDRPFSILNLHILNTDLTTTLLNHGTVSGETNVFIEDQSMDEYRQHIESASCFCNSSYAIFFNSENNIVKYIWLDYNEDLSIENDISAISKLLNQLGEKYSLILIDWYKKIIIDLSVKENTLQYLIDTAGNIGIANSGA